MQQKQIVLALSLALATAVAHAQLATIAVSPTLGQAANATSDNAIAIGANATAGLTQAGGIPTLVIPANWNYNLQIAIGTASVAWGAGDIAIGGVAASQPALGVTSSATAVGNASASWGNGSSAFGYGAWAGATNSGVPVTTPTVFNATALGSQSRASSTGSTAVGSNAVANGATATAVGSGSIALGNNSVALGAGSVATRANSVEVGNRVVSGVANGTQATDAINLGQLQAAIAGVGGIDANAIINQANVYTEQAINAVRREYSRAIAAVAAQPMLPALAPGERAVAVGGGFYNGQQAIGIAVGQAINESAMVNAGIATTGGRPVAKVGAAWKF